MLFVRRVWYNGFHVLSLTLCQSRQVPVWYTASFLILVHAFCNTWQLPVYQCKANGLKLLSLSIMEIIYALHPMLWECICCFCFLALCVPFILFPCLPSIERWIHICSTWLKLYVTSTVCLVCYRECLFLRFLILCFSFWTKRSNMLLSRLILNIHANSCVFRPGSGL